VAPQGARFVVRLPSHAGVTHAAQAPEPEPPSDRRCRVLVIDDERDVADLNAEVLARGGFEAVAAYSAEEALDEMQRSPFDAVISDLNMPGIDGRGVFEAIRAEFAGMLDRTGFITGDTMGTASQEFLKESRRPFLEKPVSPRELRDFAARLAGREAEQ
jgi:CheY-like chemotaxis protein